MSKSMPKAVSRIAIACSLLLAALWWVASLPLPVRAATDTVSTCDEGTLRNVINSAASGDTVNFGCSGTIMLSNVISLSTNLTIDGAGHYPHAQSPDEVAALVIPFLKEHARA